MCDHCQALEKELQGKAVLDMDFYHSLLYDAGLLKSTDEPDFEIDENIGEGEASPAEKKYRQELLTLIAAIFPAIKKIIKSNDSLETKIKKIDKQLATFKEKANSLARKSVDSNFKSGVAKANENLDKIFDDIKKIRADQAAMNAILEQQLYNIEDITNYLRGRLIQGLYMDEVNSVYSQDKRDETFLYGVFNEAQSRLDKMGVFGYLKSFDMGNLTTLLAGAALMGAVLEADWVTCEEMGTCAPTDDPEGDGPVCEDCLALAENGPYLLTAWPEEPHFGCRCGRRNVRILGT